jgi:exopolysaccharide biosynthesis protein
MNVNSGLNTRTAIGQRADGSVLLLVIEGRQTSSLGATYADLINIMLEFGAVNAANLDGGMSSSMAYQGEEILKNSSVSATRDMPTAFIIMP